MSDPLLKEVRCPVCTRMLFKQASAKEFAIEIKCNGCKSILRIASTNGIDIAIKEQPYRPHYPKEHK